MYTRTHVRGKKKAYTSAKIMIYSGSGPVVYGAGQKA